MTAPCVLELRELAVERGGVQVLDVPSFRLHEDEFVSLIGPNGSGKSTLLLSMMGLLERARGALLYRGREVASRSDAMECRRKMTMILQEPLLFDTTVLENVASGLRIRGVSRGETRRRAMECLERFGLAALAQRSARKLSGGEARRVSLARALVLEPEVIFLDEPFTSLDPPTRQSITEDLARSIRAARISAMLVTHDQSEALRLSDRIAVMDRGRIVQSDAPSAVVNDPVNDFVASCVGMETIVEGVVERAAGREIVVAAGGHQIHAVADASLGERVYCCIRPENVLIDTADPTARTSARNVFAATIASAAAMGPHLKLRLDCGFALVAHVTAESYAGLGLERARRVFASVKATAIHVIRKSDGAPGAAARRAP